MTSDPPPAGPPVPGTGLGVTVAQYVLVRIALVSVVAGLLVLAGAPFVVSVLVGLIVALPLSMVLFRGLRGRLDAALAEASRRRAVEREALRARLRGDLAPPPGPPSDQRAHREPDRGEH